MKRKQFAAALAVTAAIALLAAPSPSQALSLGVYGSAGGGLADWRNSGFDGFDDRRDTRHAGAGVVLDTASPFTPLNYRLSIGWERIEHERAFGSAGLKMEGVVVDQDLTVDLIYGPGPLRMWAGPELRLAFLNGSPDGAPGPDQDFLALGIGPVLGFDFAVSPALAISWKFGYLVTGYAGRGDSAFSDDRNSSVGEGHAYATLAFLFNTWRGRPEPGRPESRPEPYPRRW
jgi:hypothetical protein